MIREEPEDGIYLSDNFFFKLKLDDKIKAIVAATYYGWMLGKGMNVTYYK